MILFLDCETFCEVPINDGTHRYAEEVEIMIETWAIDDGPIQLADRTAGEESPFSLFDPEDFDTIVIHQSAFDRTVYRHCDGLILPVERIVDTMVQAQSHGLPGGLDKLCDIFQVDRDKAKDKAGKALIQLFCKPPPKNAKRGRATRHTHPVEWERFKDYAKLDIAAMREIHRKMPKWNYPGRPGDNRVREHELWQLDQRMNDRGFKVDLDLARAAITTVADAKKIMDARTRELTDNDLRSTTQRDKLKAILAEFGVDLPDMQSSTLERRIEDPNLPWYVRELLAMRLQTTTTSNAKYPRLLKSVSSDGRLRGTVQFTGAVRTKRWAGRIFQPQNLPRPEKWFTAEEQELAIEAMKAGAAELIYDEPIKVASNALRGVIVADEGRKLVVSDLGQIEPRISAWLAGEEWKLQAFRDLDAGTGEDIYRQTAARMLNKPVADVAREERQSHGKHPEMACIYGGSKGALFAIATLFNYVIDEVQAMQIVRMWREIHPKIADWDTGIWKKLDTAARQAILNPNRTFEAGEHIRFERWKEWLRMELPSGGYLNYARPAIVEDPRRPGSTSISYMGVNSYTRRWERLHTFGGKLLADATQGTAREIMAYNLPAIEEAGFPPVLLVHDEVVTEPLDDSNFSVDRLNALLARRPEWADERLPLSAGGFEAYRYRKD